MCKVYSDVTAATMQPAEEKEIDGKGKTVLLCTSCSGEAHLSCLGLEKVPYDEWYCDDCKSRGTHKKDTAFSSAINSVIDSARRTELETKLTRIYAHLHYGNDKK